MDAITPTDQPRSRWPRPVRSACYVAVLIAAIALSAVLINVTSGVSPSASGGGCRSAPWQPAGCAEMGQGP